MWTVGCCTALTCLPHDVSASKSRSLLRPLRWQRANGATVRDVRRRCGADQQKDPLEGIRRLQSSGRRSLARAGQRNIDWPNGSARLRGKDALRSYWTHQWTEIRTHDEPVQITELAPNKSVVRIGQVVRALDGSPVSEGWFEHTHQIEDDVIVRMDIENVATVTPAGDSG